MLQNRRNKKLIAGIIVVGAVLVISIILIVFKMSNTQSDPLVLKGETTAETSPNGSTTKPIDETGSASSVESSTTQPDVDPTRITTVMIEPMSITVSYIKGIDGFDYEVMRSPGGTKYVQLSSSRLAGSKCTNDIGQFASIIEKPTTDEKSTLVKSVTVNTVEYGLSLADETCTSDVELLKQYQTSFSDVFNLLK